MKQRRNGGITIGENLEGDQAHTFIAWIGKLRPKAIQDQTDKHRGSISVASRVVLVLIGLAGGSMGNEVWSRTQG